MYEHLQTLNPQLKSFSVYLAQKSCTKASIRGTCRGFAQTSGESSQICGRPRISAKWMSPMSPSKHWVACHSTPRSRCVTGPGRWLGRHDGQWPSLRWWTRPLRNGDLYPSSKSSGTLRHLPYFFIREYSWVLNDVCLRSSPSLSLLDFQLSLKTQMIHTSYTWTVSRQAIAILPLPGIGIFHPTYH